jgi:hypothetical protein
VVSTQIWAAPPNSDAYLMVRSAERKRLGHLSHLAVARARVGERPTPDRAPADCYMTAAVAYLQVQQVLAVNGGGPCVSRSLC